MSSVKVSLSVFAAVLVSVDVSPPHQTMMNAVTIMAVVIRYATTLLVAFSAAVRVDTDWMMTYPPAMVS